MHQAAEGKEAHRIRHGVKRKFGIKILTPGSTPILAEPNRFARFAEGFKDSFLAPSRARASKKNRGLHTKAPQVDFPGIGLKRDRVEAHPFSGGPSEALSLSTERSEDSSRVKHPDGFIQTAQTPWALPSFVKENQMPEGGIARNGPKYIGCLVLMCQMIDRTQPYLPSSSVNQDGCWERTVRDGIEGSQQFNSYQLPSLPNQGPAE